MSELVLEKNFNLTGWSFAKLNDVCLKITDGTHKTPKYMDKGIRFISIANIRPFRFRSENYIRYISKQEHNEISKSVDPKTDDILLTKIGTLGYAKIVDWDWDFNIFVGLALLRPDQRILLPKYLEMIMNSPKIVQKVIDGSNGTGRKTLPLMNLRPIIIPIPPFPEQKRIMEKIDEILSRINSIKETLNVTHSELSKFYSSFLNQLFNGNLTETWRDEFSSKLKTSDLLIETILKKSKNKKTSNFDFTETSYLPNSWILCPLDNISKKITDGTHKTPKYIEKGVVFLSAKNILEQTISFEKIRFISKNEHKELIKRCNPEFGDVMLTKSGTIGRTAVVPENSVFSLFESVALIKCDLELINPEFLSHFLEFHVNKQSVLQTMKGVAVKHFHLEDIRKTKIPLPNLVEQEKILELLKKTHTQILFHKKSIKRLLDNLEKLQLTVLNQALEGKLVPQDPNDESAEIILQKIKQEKEQLKQKEKSKKRKKNVK